MVAPSAVPPLLTSAALPLFALRSLKKPSPAGVIVHFWQL
jgi:hypothetical protein